MTAVIVCGLILVLVVAVTLVVRRPNRQLQAYIEAETVTEAEHPAGVVIPSGVTLVYEDDGRCEVVLYREEGTSTLYKGHNDRDAKLLWRVNQPAELRINGVLRGRCQ